MILNENQSDVELQKQATIWINENFSQILKKIIHYWSIKDNIDAPLYSFRVYVGDYGYDIYVYGGKKNNFTGSFDHVKKTINILFPQTLINELNEWIDKKQHNPKQSELVDSFIKEIIEKKSSNISRILYHEIIHVLDEQMHKNTLYRDLYQRDTVSTPKALRKEIINTKQLFPRINDIPDTMPKSQLPKQVAYYNNLAEQMAYAHDIVNSFRIDNPNGTMYQLIDYVKSHVVFFYLTENNKKRLLKRVYQIFSMT